MQNGKLGAHGSEQVNTPGILRAGEGAQEKRGSGQGPGIRRAGWIFACFISRPNDAAFDALWV